MNNKILIYSDGASRGNPGPGGWGAIILRGHNVLEIGGAEKNTTNNRMELTAVISALSNISEKNQIRIFTDSEYLINGITKWVFSWNSNNWKTKTGGDVLNKDLWQKLIKVVKNKEIEWKKVKGHAGHSANERADEIATTFADKKEDELNLFSGNIKDYSFNLSQPNTEHVESSSSERKNARAYSYLSLVDEKLMIHNDWQSCKERVNGKAGAKFRKAVSKQDQDEIIKSWGLKN